MKEFIFANYKGISNQELTDKFNLEFGVSATRKQIKAFKNNQRLDSGLTGRFEKGHLPANKGTKGISKANETSYKQGHIPYSTLPVGTELELSDGYVWVKINDIPKAKKCTNWKQKHRLIYENYYGPIPKNHYVLFLDGNRRNFEIDNLICISKSEMLYLNKLGFKFTNKELTKAALNMARMILMANTKKRNRYASKV